ncbi:hypothetical protein B9Z55_012566 [Caenorhabditis nigoni]|uniref:Uncharacterized protein n=1 Tax=Caenorhabditis nigoni TaxID=1611254 RepID=A0A2G5TXY6_9PELO|nr:hypothetical protein B9Z55_012566 [Caenorhabditis nigoni]
MKPSIILSLLAILIFSRCASSQEPDDDFFSFVEFPDVRNVSEGFQTNASDFHILEEGIELPEESTDLPNGSTHHRHPKNLKNSLVFPNVRSIDKATQTNASDFEILKVTEMLEESMDLPDESTHSIHPKNLKNSLELPNVRSIDKATQTNASDFEILEEDIEMPEESMDLPDGSTHHVHPKNLKNSKPTEQMNIVISIVITVLLILLLVIVVVLGPCVILIIVLIMAGLTFKIIFCDFRIPVTDLSHACLS